MKKLFAFFLFFHSWMIFAQVNTEYHIQGVVKSYDLAPLAGASVTLYEKMIA